MIPQRTILHNCKVFLLYFQENNVLLKLRKSSLAKFRRMEIIICQVQLEFGASKMEVMSFRFRN